MCAVPNMAAFFIIIIIILCTYKKIYDSSKYAVTFISPDCMLLHIPYIQLRLLELHFQKRCEFLSNYRH
jgi:hypothetical protein